MQNIEHNCGAVKAVSNFGTRFFFRLDQAGFIAGFNTLGRGRAPRARRPQARAFVPRLPSKKFSENLTIDSVPGRKGAEVKMRDRPAWAVSGIVRKFDIAYFLSLIYEQDALAGSMTDRALSEIVRSHSPIRFRSLL
jgi:hypothetical protein